MPQPWKKTHKSRFSVYACKEGVLGLADVEPAAQRCGAGWQWSVVCDLGFVPSSGIFCVWMCLCLCVLKIDHFKSCIHHHAIKEKQLDQDISMMEEEILYTYRISRSRLYHLWHEARLFSQTWNVVGRELILNRQNWCFMTASATDFKQVFQQHFKALTSV